MSTNKFIITALIIFCLTPGLAAAKDNSTNRDLGDVASDAQKQFGRALPNTVDLKTVAERIERKIYNTLPREKGEALFKKAFAFAVDTLTGNLLKTEQEQFAKDFSNSYIRTYYKNLGPHLKSSLTPDDRKEMTRLVHDLALMMLEAKSNQHRDRLNKAIPQCTDAIQTDVVSIAALGGDTGFTTDAAMPNTSECMQKNANLKQYFANDLQAERRLTENDLFGMELLNYIKRVVPMRNAPIELE